MQAVRRVPARVPWERAIMPLHDDDATTADALPTVDHALREQNSNRHSFGHLRE